MNPDGMLGIESFFMLSNPLDKISHVLVLTLHSNSKAKTSRETLQLLRSTAVQSHLKIYASIKIIRKDIILIV